MRIGGENRPSWIRQKHWERLAEAIAIKPRLVLKTLQDMAAAVGPAAQTLAADFQKAHGKGPIIDKILAVVAQRAKTV